MSDVLARSEHGHYRQSRHFHRKLKGKAVASVYQQIWSHAQGSASRWGPGAPPPDYWWVNARGPVNEAVDEGIVYRPLLQDRFGNPLRDSQGRPFQGNFRNYDKFGHDKDPQYTQSQVGVGALGIELASQVGGETGYDEWLKLRSDGRYDTLDYYGNITGEREVLFAKRTSWFYGDVTRDLVSYDGSGNYHFTADGTMTEDQRSECFSKFKLYPGVKGVATWHTMPTGADDGIFGPAGTYHLTAPVRTQEKTVSATLEAFPDAPTISGADEVGHPGGVNCYLVFWFGRTRATLPAWPYTLTV